ncbi:MAG: thioredoxin domain-containing protein, partial [Candidatus Thorarchaeota archaeon]
MKQKWKANGLVHEKSPYLLQHAYNPVDWYPWGDEAFEKAKKEDKPIFLSIGYSTCHWCHVMEHESFEDEEVANLMNENFVCIKVDREERPDIDKVYMEVAQMMTGRGGWPLTIIMTPNKRPFIAATYISKQDRYGQRGMLSLIPIIHNLWTHEREKVDLTVEQVHEALVATGSTGKEELTIDSIEAAFSQYSQRFDEKLGGFGQAPKFPSPHNLLLILRYWKRTGDDWALHMVEKTLQEMRKGGIFDHIGFGFHRYSTDSKWLLPHFEKMLYDQAMLMLAYTEAFQATRKEEYAKVVREIAEYLFRDMKHERGAFYSAEDADSEGVEGKFYVWSMEEITKILTEQEVRIASKGFNISEKGNFREEATGEETGLNIPHITTGHESIASSLELEHKDFETELESVRKKLFSVREKRVRPHLDDKILTDWNGLMIAALAKAARILDDADLLEAAKASATFILEEMIDSDGHLYHRFREDEVKIRGFLDDYAFLVWALIELYETTFDITYLQRAKSINS